MPGLAGTRWTPELRSIPRSRSISIHWSSVGHTWSPMVIITKQRIEASRKLVPAITLSCFLATRQARPHPAAEPVLQGAIDMGKTFV